VLKYKVLLDACYRKQYLAVAEAFNGGSIGTPQLCAKGKGLLVAGNHFKAALQVVRIKAAKSFAAATISGRTLGSALASTAATCNRLVSCCLQAASYGTP